jgi:hypothetical protein
MVPKTTFTTAAISAVPNETSSAFSVRRSVAMAKKSAQPRAAERQTSAVSGMRMISVR